MLLEHRFYGRRKGRALGSRQQQLVDVFLPSIHFDKSLCDDQKFFEQNVCLEIGFGGGEHLLKRAQHNPHMIFIGCEPFLPGVVSLLGDLEKAKESGNPVDNLLIFNDDVRFLLDKIPDNSLDQVVLLFADPWPKARHHKRRFVQTEQIKNIHRLLKEGGSWRIATDDPGYQDWVLERFDQPEIRALFGQERPDIWQRPDVKDWPHTRYEAKAIRAGRTPLYLEFLKKMS